jgi:hypothetical protein
MSTIASRVKEISQLHIDKWPTGKVFAPEKVAHYDGVTVMKLKTGYRIYSTSVKDRLFYSEGIYLFTTGMMKCLWKMKIITKEQMEEHLKNIQLREEKSARKYALEYIMKASEKYGFELTGEQYRKLGGLVCVQCDEAILPGKEKMVDGEPLHEECVEEATKG